MVALKWFFFALVIAVVSSQEQTKPKPAETLSEQSFVREDGYNFAFKTSDGVSRQEEANLITVGDQQGISVKGSYSYLTPDGQEYEVTFTADDKGYKPQIRIIPPGSGSQ